MALIVLRILGLVFVTAWFLLGGVAHFTSTDMFTGITPDWVPFPRLVVWGTGGLEIAAAGLLWWPRVRRWVGLALIAFCLAVTPVHVEMLIEADQYRDLGLPFLWGRLLFQPVLMGIIWWVTRERSASVSGAEPDAA